MENSKWYHKKWIRILAGVLVVLLIFTTVGYNLLRLNAESFYAALVGEDEYLKNNSNEYYQSFDTENLILNMGLYNDLKKFIEDGDFDQAIKKTKALIDSENDTERLEQLHQLLCELQYNTGNYEEAAKEAEICIKDLKYSSDVYLFYYIGAISYMHLAEYEKSRDYIDIILELSDDAELYYYRGINNMALEAFSEAIDDFEKSMELGKDSIEIYYDIGICKISIGDTKTGIENLRYVIDNSESSELATAARNIISAISQD